MRKIELWTDPISAKGEKMEGGDPNEEITGFKINAERVKSGIDEFTRHLEDGGNNKENFIDIVNKLQEAMGKLNFDINMMRRNNNGK